MNTKKSVIALASLLLLWGQADAATQLSFSNAVDVSDTPQLGNITANGRLATLNSVDPNTGYHPLLIAYGNGLRDSTPQAATGDQTDIWIARSVDDGITWIRTNVSNTGALSSKYVDNDGLVTTAPLPYFAENEKPSIVASGNNVLVLWRSKYCLGGSQGSINYNGVTMGGVTYYEVPYACIWTARSKDGGLSWSTPQQLTDGSRDAVNIMATMAKSGFAAAWQEDPAGLVLESDKEGPCEGGSGANAHDGTNIFYDAISKNAFQTGTPFPVPTQVSNNPASGTDARAASRPAISLVALNDTTSQAVLAYEETKKAKTTGETGGTADTADEGGGKAVHFHSFPFLTPDVNSDGTILSDTAMNARRVFMATQDSSSAGNGGVTIALIYRQSATPGCAAPADIMLSRDHGFNPGAFDPPIDVSNMIAGDNSKSHRVLLRGNFIAVGYNYTTDKVAADAFQANYNFYVRTSSDGGASWNAPANVSGLSNPMITAFEPRLVGTPGAIVGSPDPRDSVQNTRVFYVAYETLTNDTSYTPIGVSITSTRNGGASYESRQTLVSGDAAESQLRSSPDGSRLDAVWVITRADGSTDAYYTQGTTVEVYSAPTGVSSGSSGCAISLGINRPLDPVIPGMLLAAAAQLAWQRRRRMRLALARRSELNEFQQDRKRISRK